jgi:hypothetical protein
MKTNRLILIVSIISTTSAWQSVRRRMEGIRMVIQRKATVRY